MSKCLLSQSSALPCFVPVWQAHCSHSTFCYQNHHCEFSFWCEISFGCEHFLNQLLTGPGSQTLFDWQSERQSAHPADRITKFHFSASTFIFSFFCQMTRVLFIHLPPAENRPLETINWHILRILKRFITCAIVQASSILKNIMSVRSGTHLKYTGSFNVCCRQQNGRPLFLFLSTYCCSILSENRT